MGYLLGGLLFVVVLPALMWLCSCMPVLNNIPLWRIIAAAILCVCGLSLSVWSIVYMRNVGKGNPMDAFNHEVAPRTRNLMTDGPYRFSRNPMLTGTFVYLLGLCLSLWTWQALLFLVIFIGIMLLQVRSEEKRLHRDFGDEYEAYCRRTGRFLPFNWKRQENTQNK